MEQSTGPSESDWKIRVGKSQRVFEVLQRDNIKKMEKGPIIDLFLIQNKNTVLK